MSRGLIAAGGLLWRRRPGGGTEIGLVHRPRYDDWTFPKGKAHNGEGLLTTAVREILEETGHRVVLGRRLPDTTYQVAEGVKTVSYWTARDGGGEFLPGDEVDEIRWLDKEHAVRLLSYDYDRRLLAALDTDRTLDTRSVLLVRHAKAGKRSEWSRPDRERPLTAAGRKQAEAIRRMLPHFGIVRLHSAPLVRCVETLEGYARDIDVKMVEESLLSEEGYWPASEAAAARIVELAAESVYPVVVCSQGGVIPDLVEQLTTRAGLAIHEFPSRKASAWVLSFASPGPDPVTPPELSLIAADHYPDPFS
jgi:8-oxo-(d)GTP phosphatase